MKKRLLLLSFSLLAGLALSVLLYFYPAEGHPFWPKCLFHQMTGFYCPGCGNTRALSALLHGQLRESLAKNVLFIPSCAALLVAFLCPKVAYNRFFAWGVAIVFILFFILRNLPWYPFVLLAPH